MALRWTSALSIGVEELDAQHRELFARVEELEDAMLRRDRATAVHVLRFLGEYVQVHFTAEEGLMCAVEYPRRAEHQAEHAGFAATIAALQRVLEQDGATAALVFRTEREVSTWLRDHVYSSDAALGAFVRARHRSTEARGWP